MEQTISRKVSTAFRLDQRTVDMLDALAVLIGFNNRTRALVHVLDNYVRMLVVQAKQRGLITDAELNELGLSSIVGEDDFLTAAHLVWARALVLIDQRDPQFFLEMCLGIADRERWQRRLREIGRGDLIDDLEPTAKLQSYDTRTGRTIAIDQNPPEETCRE